MQTKLLALARRLAPGTSAVQRVKRLSGGANDRTWPFDMATDPARISIGACRVPEGVILAGLDTGLRVARHGFMGPSKEASS